MNNIVPTPAEFFFLTKLYCAHKRGYALGCDSPPTCYKRLAAHHYIEFISPQSVFNKSKQWEFHISDSGVDYFLFWLYTIIVGIVGIAVSVLVA